MWQILPLLTQFSLLLPYHPPFAVVSVNIQDAAERTPLFEKRINSKPKKIRQMFFYFWKANRMPFYINVFWINHHSSGGLEYWYTDVALPTRSYDLPNRGVLSAAPCTFCPQLCITITWKDHHVVRRKVMECLLQFLVLGSSLFSCH